jgi:AraC-like DNA-binding protein
LAILLIRSAPLIGFRDTVRELGGDPERMLKEAGLSPLVLENPELIIPFDAFLRLMNIAVQDTGCEYFGLLLSKHLDLSILGAIGLLLQHSDTVGDALNSLVRYYPTRFQGAELELKVEEEIAYLYNHNKQSKEDIKQNVYLSAGVGLTLMKSLCGKDWTPTELHMTDKLPEFADYLSQFFGAPVRFSQDQNRMVFGASDLNKKIAGKFGQLGRYVQPQIDEMENQLPTDIVSRTEYLIRILLPEGNCNAENITSLLSTNERSLQRKLKARGTSFRQLVEKVRKSIALQQLRHSDFSKSQLAYVLGYTELSAFTRAFKRWFGVAPSKWKDP